MRFISFWRLETRKLNAARLPLVLLLSPSSRQTDWIRQSWNDAGASVMFNSQTLLDQCEAAVTHFRFTSLGRRKSWSGLQQPVRRWEFDRLLWSNILRVRHPVGHESSHEPNGQRDTEF